MKIAQVIPLLEYFPPKKYGGIERVVDELTQELAKQGHEITIFGPGGGPADEHNRIIVPCTPLPTIHDDLKKTAYYEVCQFLEVIRRQHEFDIIHFHYEPKIAQIESPAWDINLMSYIEVPKLITFHNLTDYPKHLEYYRTHPELWDFHYSFLSNSHMEPLSFFQNKRAINNGVPVDRMPFGETSDEYMVFLGRFTKNKGTYEAIQAAKATGRKLILAAKIDAGEPEYFEEKVKPCIDNDLITYIGEVDFNEKTALLKNAYCTLCPVQWREPFGLVPVESLACGTPVIAFRNGSLPELIEDGKTGFLVDTVEGMIESISKIPKISRHACRKSAEERFNTKLMSERYLEYYKEIIDA